ncbi:hypothetical protein BH20ACI4_BH20ACI4_23250 [soil metagenome]
MNIKSNIKYLWLACGIFSLVLTGFLWFGFESDNLQNTILALDGLMFVLSVPCSLFFVPVAAAANYYLEIDTFSSAGIYLNTVFLFVLGLMQWFWLARFWYPTESVYQKLDLIKD